MVLFLTSCGKDDQASLEDSTWILLSDEVIECDDSENNEDIYIYGTVLCTAADEDCDYTEYSFTDGNGTATNTYSYDGMVEVDPTNFTYTIKDDAITFCFETNDCYSGTFVVDGDNLTISIDATADSGSGCISKATFKKK